MGTPPHYGKGDALQHALSTLRPPALRSWCTHRGLWTGLRYGSLFVAIFAACDFTVGRIGLASFTLFLVLTLFGFLYAYLSWRSLLIPLSMMVLAVGGFRFLWGFQVPGLPDLFLDRVAMIWLVVIFSVESVVKRRTLRPPYLLDTLIIVNALFLFFDIIYYDFGFFNLWTKSYLLPYVAYFMAKNIVTNQKSMRAFLTVLAVLGFYYAVTSIGEKFHITQLVWPKVILHTKTQWWQRSNGPFAHAPLFGITQAMILPVYMYFIATAKNRVFQVASIIGFLMALTGLYFTYTRGPWLAGIGGLFVAIILNRRYYLRISIPAVVLLPLIAVFVLGVGNDPVMKNRVENEDTMTARIGVAVTAARMWRENPLIGVGFFRYRLERDNYVDPIEVPVFGTIRFTNFRHTSIHDIYLGPLAETGIVGTLIQLAIYWVIFKTLRRHYRNRHGPPHFRLYLLPIFGGMFVAYLIGGISIDYRFFSMVGVIFFSAAGIIYGYTGENVIQATSVNDSDGRTLDEEA